MKKPPVNMDDFCMDEVPYTEEEQIIIINELDNALRIDALEKATTKKKLIDWYAVLTIKKPDNYCPNVTTNDLIEIAKSEGFQIL